MLGGSETFNSFLRKAQQVRGQSCGEGLGLSVCGKELGCKSCFSLQETQQIPTEEVVLEVLLSNGQKVKVTILTSDQTEDVLEVPELSFQPLLLCSVVSHMCGALSAW